MPTKPIIRRISLLTSAFPHGAYQSQDINQPDLRAPSVKGQLRWWFDALFQDKVAEDSFFGGLKLPRQGDRPGPQSSRVIVRVQPLQAVETRKARFIPHKVDHRGNYNGGTKSAILPGTRYEMALIPKREGWSPDEAGRLERVLDTWILLGAIGQRANRGAGSIWPSPAPYTPELYMQGVRQLLAGSKLRAALLERRFDREEDLRFMAGDFLADDAFTANITPFGSARPRKPSLLKLRAARFDGSFRLVALWDGRFQSSDTLAKAVDKLAHSKEIGRLLQEAVPTLCS